MPTQGLSPKWHKDSCHRHTWMEERYRLKSALLSLQCWFCRLLPSQRAKSTNSAVSILWKGNYLTLWLSMGLLNWVKDDAILQKSVSRARCNLPCTICLYTQPGSFRLLEWVTMCETPFSDNVWEGFDWLAYPRVDCKIPLLFKSRVRCSLQPTPKNNAKPWSQY